jgi:DNA-directed RNA polymerase alpha subunit
MMSPGDSRRLRELLKDPKVKTIEEAITHINSPGLALKDDVKIIHTKLSGRAKNALADNKIRTIQDLLQVNTRNISEWKGVGPIVVKEIENFIISLGYKLNDDY